MAVKNCQTDDLATRFLEPSYLSGGGGYISGVGGGHRLNRNRVIATDPYLPDSDHSFSLAPHDFANLGEAIMVVNSTVLVIGEWLVVSRSCSVVNR